MLQVADLDADRIKADLRDKVHGVKDVLGRQVPQARQMLRKLLEDKIELEPVGRGRERGYKFRGALTVDRLIGGDAFVGANNTPVSGGPNGIRAVVGQDLIFEVGPAPLASVASTGFE